MNPKNLLKRLIEGFGYEIRRRKPLGELSPVKLPFVRRFELGFTRFDFWIADRDTYDWYQQEPWLNCPELRGYRDLIRPNDRILEIGSHHGFTGLVLAGLAGRGGSVLGVEARPLNAMVAQANLGLNREATNLAFLNAIAADQKAEMRITDENDSYVTTSEAFGLTVPSVTGDALDRNHGPFNVLKVVVEGFEHKVLAGCKAVLACRPKINIELHMNVRFRYGWSPEDIFRLLDIGTYRGTIYSNRDPEHRAFDPATIPADTVAHLFLEPK